jgi:hypothetical protein
VTLNAERSVEDIAFEVLSLVVFCVRPSRF